MAQAACTLFATRQLEATVHAVGREFHRLLLAPSPRGDGATDDDAAGIGDSTAIEPLRVAQPCVHPSVAKRQRFVAPLDAVIPPDTGRSLRGDADVSCGLPIMGELAARCQHAWGDELVMLIHYCCLCFENAPKSVQDTCRRGLLNLALNVSSGERVLI